MRRWNICFIIFLFEFPGFGCDTAAVVNILAHRDSTQRALIQQEYRTMYSDDLLKRLSKELTGKLEVLMPIYISKYYIIVKAWTFPLIMSHHQLSYYVIEN